MNVQSLSFLLFLASAVLLCRAAGRFGRRAALLALLCLSLLFYVWSGTPDVLWSCGLLALSAAVSFFAAERISAASGRRRTALFAAAVCWHVAVLAVFKYTGFLSGGRVHTPFVPLGISFFTFQQIWYLREVHARRFAPAEPLAFFTCTFFFPTVSSGPILKPQSLLPQLEQPLSPTQRDTAAGIYAVACGLAKKVLLADNLGVLVNNGWNNLSDLTALTAWFVILGYTLQLYFDFSGYCDIAAGCARLLGLHLPVNFDSPYRSLSVTEFWKRWHMTLTAFLRECVYFPLGGSRGGRRRTCRNILLVYLISGIWHGAGWTFLLWGMLHGLAQVAERLWGSRRDKLPAWLRWGMTFLFVNLAWVFFRAPDLPSAAALLRAAFSGGFGGLRMWLVRGLFTREISALTLFFPGLEAYTVYLRCMLILGGGLLAALWPRNVIRQMDFFRPTAANGLALAALSAWVILSFTGVVTFIYSNF